MKSTTPAVPYPKEQLWNIDIPDNEKLRIINPTDFPEDQILKGLGIEKSSLCSSFGITNKEEIIARRDLIQFLVENPKIRNFLSYHTRVSNLPLDEASFLAYFGRETTKHWEHVRKIIARLQGKTLPARLKTFLTTLEQSLVLEQTENEFGSTIAEHILQTTALEGIINFGFSIGNDGKLGFYSGDTSLRHVHGYKRYSKEWSLSSLLRDRITMRRWTKKVGIGQCVEFFINWRVRRALKAMVIKSLPSKVQYEIRAGIKKRLSLLSWDNIYSQKGDISVYFSYSEEGLSLQIVSMTFEPAEKHSSNDYRDSFLFKEFTFDKSFNFQEKEKSRHEQALEKDVREQRTRIATARQLSLLLAQDKDLFRKSFLVESKESDETFRWQYIKQLYADTRFSEAYNALTVHRSYLRQSLSTLKEIIFLTEKFLDTAQQLKAPLCFPTIAEDNKSVISFEQIFPVHLLSREDINRVSSIHSFPPLGGNIIGLTGTHGGGKTVTNLSITDNLFLAQSGLPVFGKEFVYNIKRVVGVVFLERGDGSTCELLVRKIRDVLAGIQHIPGNETVVILDELGTGTQESAGFELGRDVLGTLKEQGCSVLFSTQILALAELAERNLGAHCFKMADGHRIVEGIADGGMKELRTRMNLDKYITT